MLKTEITHNSLYQSELSQWIMFKWVKKWWCSFGGNWIAQVYRNINRNISLIFRILTLKRQWQLELSHNLRSFFHKKSAILLKFQTLVPRVLDKVTMTVCVLYSIYWAKSILTRKLLSKVQRFAIISEVGRDSYIV